MLVLFAVLPNGELLIADNNYLTKVDQDGNVSDRISLNGLRSGLTGLDFERCMLTVNRYSGLQYDSSKNSVLMEVYFYDLPGNLKFAPFMVEIELSSKAASLIDLPSISRAFLNRESMGELNGVNFLRVNNEILVSPKYSSEVFKIKADLAERFEVNSAYTNNKADPLKLLDKRLNQSKIEHNHNSVEFYSIVHDPINGNVLSCS